MRCVNMGFLSELGAMLDASGTARAQVVSYCCESFGHIRGTWPLRESRTISYFWERP